VRAEDVLNDRGRTLRMICSWLGVRADREAIDSMWRPELSPFARPGPPAAPAGADPAFLHDPVPHEVEVPDTLVPPWELPAEVQTRVTELAVAFGYRA
jgi:hypothetical protein